MLYLVVKLLHILAIVVALGANVTYSFWISRAERTSQNLVYTLQTIKALDRQLANRAYLLLLVTGVILIFAGHWAPSTPWLILALVLFVVVGAMGALVYTPTLRRQIQLAESGSIKTPEYLAVSRRSMLLGITSIAAVVVIVLLMVVKPQLWS